MRREGHQIDSANMSETPGVSRSDQPTDEEGLPATIKQLSVPDTQEKRSQLLGEYASCKTMDTVLFFPGVGASVALSEAKEVCEKCVVRDVCLEFALTGAEKFGIWGGMSERQRRRIRRTR